jgi:hypothetical protein
VDNILFRQLVSRNCQVNQCVDLGSTLILTWSVDESEDRALIPTNSFVATVVFQIQLTRGLRLVETP